MNNRISLQDIKEAYAAHGYDFLTYSDKRIGGYTLKSNKNQKNKNTTYLSPIIKLACGRVVEKPVVKTGLQVIERIVVTLPYGSPDMNDPETAAKIESGEIKLERAEIRFSKITEDKIKQREDEDEETYQTRVRQLIANNQLLCEALEILATASEKLSEKLAATDPNELGFTFRNADHFMRLKVAKKKWEPALPAGVHHSIMKTMSYKTNEEGERELTCRENPAFALRFEADKENYGPIVRSFWSNKKKVYVPFVRDRAVALQGDPKKLLTGPENEELSIMNIKKLIPPGSLIEGSFRVDCLCACPVGSVFYCFIESLFVEPSKYTSQEFDPDADIIDIDEQIGAIKRTIPDNLLEQVKDLVDNDDLDDDAF